MRFSKGSAEQIIRIDHKKEFGAQFGKGKCLVVYMTYRRVVKKPLRGEKPT